MSNNISKIDDLVKRAFKLVPEGIPLYPTQVKKMEKILGITFANDLKKISERFRFDFLNTFAGFHNFEDDENNGVIPETLRLRKVINFPHNSLFLYEDDASVLILKTQKDPAEPSPIYWIDVMDVERYCEEEPLECQQHIFPSFTDFFEYLVTEEEREREEEKKLQGA